ncbi:MAG: SGNH/GDSL hydrolase family protein [Bryobacteraceae bacterium]
MYRVLVYGDSLSWGIIPDTRQRLPFRSRWPGVMEHSLTATGLSVRVIENCLNGRRTVWEDPFKPGRNGLLGLAQLMEVHSPLSLIILFLGLNDFQFSHPYNDAWSAAQGVTTLVNEIRRAPIEPGMPVPPILLVCPPRVRSPKGAIAPKFRGAEERSMGLAEAYADAASALGCPLFDAGSVTNTSPIDGVHFDADQHLKLGRALAEAVAAILRSSDEPDF